MTQPNLLELAKQGDAQAIASLMNRQLQPKGITVKVALKDACLQIMLESAQVPNQQALVAFVRKGIVGLGAASIERVGVSYMDLPGVITSAKLATQLFEKSKDYHVCPYLSELIKKNMFYYELSFQCFHKRYENYVFSTDLEEIIINLFPELKGKRLYINFDSIVQTIWSKAAQCSDEINEILEFPNNND